MNQPQLTREELLKIYHRYHPNPKLYCNEVLGITQTWELQDLLLVACPQAIAEHKHIYVASGQALGKDYIAAAISLWFLQTYIPSIVIQTAPSDRQTNKIMWGDTLHHWNNKKIDLGGKSYIEPYLEITKEDHYLLGFTTKETGATKEGGGGRFQGFHSRNIAVIVTEAQAIEDNIYDQIDAITTSENCLVIFIGNPTRARGRFAAGLRDRQNNIVFHFSCLDNPNYKEKRTVIPGLASYEWVEDKRRKWGEKDPRWIARVLGQIPDMALNTTFPLSLIEHMKSRYSFLSMHSMNAGVAVDSAGEGVDDNVLMSGKGGDVMDVFTKTLMTPTEIAHKAVEMCKAVNGYFIIFDCDGIGIGPYQEACKLNPLYLQGIQIIKFHGSAPSAMADGAAVGSEQKTHRIYENMRAEASFITRDRAHAGKASINERDIELIEDLMEEEYFTNNKGLIQIEDKEELKERLGRSPGRGDAYKMLQWAFAQDYKDKTYEDSSVNKLPAYGLMDAPLSEPVTTHNLPGYGRMD